eukprot:9145169-Heterocapsa_arctica.AAC.1
MVAEVKGSGNWLAQLSDTKRKRQEKEQPKRRTERQSENMELSLGPEAHRQVIDGPRDGKAEPNRQIARKEGKPTGKPKPTGPEGFCNVFRRGTRSPEGKEHAASAKQAPITPTTDDLTQRNQEGDQGRRIRTTDQGLGGEEASGSGAGSHGHTTVSN